MNNDKVSNSKQFKMDISKNIIEIDNAALIELLNYSIQKFPRKYLFENDKGGKVSEDTLRTYLRKISKLNNINFDIMRSIYISEAYRTTAKTVNQRESLAVKMRHSPQIAAASYFKIKTDDETNNKNNNEVIIKQQETIAALTIEINELKSKLSEVTPTENDKIFLKRKADIVARLKAGKNVKSDTIQKYNIKVDSLKSD